MAHWERLGRIYAGGDGPVWMDSHASVPFLIPLGDADTLSRVYFTPRDAENRSQIGWIDLDLKDPLKILATSETPLLNIGERGCFDDCGTMTSWIVPNDSVAHHYFIGWNVRNTVPFHNSIGLAIVSEAQAVGVPPKVDRKFAGPVLDRSVHDPFFCSNPCVMKAGDQWLMWYISGTGWLKGEEGKAARYVSTAEQNQSSWAA